MRKAGSDTPLCQVRTTHKYDTRSANCELELEAGTYEVLPKITAERNTHRKTTGKMVSTWADKNPEKLRQIGMQYDAAHAKAGVLDEDEEVEKLRKQSEEKKKKRREKRRKEEKAMKKMQKAYIEKRTGETVEDEDEISDGEEKTALKWISKKLKKKEKPSGSRHGKNKAPMHSRKSSDDASSKASLREGSNKEAKSDTENSSEAGSNTPSSTVKDEDEKKDEISESDSDDSTDTGSDSEDEPDFDKKQPWDPVCVMGLRVYAQDAVATVKLAEKEDGETLGLKEEGLNVVKS